MTKQETGISWTKWPGHKGVTWIPVTGCSIDGRKGCTSCYAMKTAGTRMKNHPAYAGLTIPTKAGPVWTGKVNVIESRMFEPLTWNQPCTIFVTSMGDLFHKEVPDYVIDTVFAVAAMCPQHQFLILTKRSALAAAYVRARARDWSPIGRQFPPGVKLHPRREYAAEAMDRQFPTDNVWMGTSVEDQDTVTHYLVPFLKELTPIMPGRLWASYEPAIGPADFSRCLTKDASLAWLVIGGESRQPGREPRPYDLRWFVRAAEQVRGAGVPVFHKQLGASPVFNLDAFGAGPWHDDQKQNAKPEHWPEWARVQEFPSLRLTAHAIGGAG